MQRIATHLWFDKEAKEAAAFYTSLFPNSRINNTSTIDDTPSGSVDLVSLELCGQDFRMISAGPLFRFTPAISFIVACDTKEEIDRLWQSLSQNGTVMMELGEYPFSDRYGWLADRYGLSWQLIVPKSGPPPQKIAPALMFTGAQAGKAEEAMNFYASIFPNSSVEVRMRYGKGQEPDREGTIAFASFTLGGQNFAAMDSAHPHNFTFNEAISLLVHCQTQEEIDRYWSQLSADPRSEQCGWLKDKYGVSWQIVPSMMDEMLTSGDSEKVARVTAAFLKMKKFDIATLKAAYEGTR